MFNFAYLKEPAPKPGIKVVSVNDSGILTTKWVISITLSKAQEMGGRKNARTRKYVQAQHDCYSHELTVTAVTHTRPRLILSWVIGPIPPSQVMTV